MLRPHTMRNIGLTSFISDTFDVIMPTPGEILVVDFGPLNQKTKLYAFNWKEIQPLMQKVCYCICML